MKTADLSALPLTDRLTASRPVSPVWFQGKLVSVEEAAKLRKANGHAQSLAGLTPHATVQALTFARTGKPSHATTKHEAPAGAGGYVAFDEETGACLGFVSFDSDDE